ncbi:hypothetical protein CDEF62S_00962 [Castellaniella defragrans]
MNDPRYVHLYGALALGLLALALLLVVAVWMLQAWRRARSGLMVDRRLLQRAGVRAGAPAGPEEGGRPVGVVLDALAKVGSGWVTGRFGGLLMAEEDRSLVERAGYSSGQRAQALFLLARVGTSLVLLVAGALLHPVGESEVMSNPLLWALLGMGLGWMLPKWVVQRRVAHRLAEARTELPLLVDLLRLLQGVGLSVDQSLHIIVDEFYEVMPVLSQELGGSLDMYARGRTREQSLTRLSDRFGDEDLAAICKLLCQVDEHGGAVQEPLAHFSERLRERRKLDLKATVGKLTVKMTAVMVLTLLPALLIVTGGAGFVAILRGLSQVTS